MSLLAEALVDEWLNQKGFFTVGYYESLKNIPKSKVVLE